MTKMNTLLAVVEHSTASKTKLVGDYAKFFKTAQGAFHGVKKTFTPREGFPEDPSKMGTTTVVTTVDEKLDWFQQQFSNWLQQVFSLEATNSRGANTVELKVGNISFGQLSAIELMRLKNILTDKSLESVFENIPVRSDAEVWVPTTNPDYSGRAVFETAMLSGVTRTTEKEEVILRDPNLDPAHLPANYQARTTIKNRLIETGDYTVQNFSGEWTQRQRAELLRRRSVLLEAVIEALKKVNDIEVENSRLDVNTFVNYLLKG